MFEERLKQIKENKKIVDNGGFNLIPFHKSFPKLSKFVPGLIRGVQYKILSYTGIGKSKLLKKLFIHEPFRFVKENPKYTLKIIFFALEESKDEFMDSLIVQRLASKNMPTSSNQLNAYTAESIDQSVLDAIESDGDYFKELSSVIDVVDYVSTPTGMFEYVIDYAIANGKFYFKGKEVNGSSVKTSAAKGDSIFDEYVPNNPNEYVIVLADHLSLVQRERGLKDIKEAMGKWSYNYSRNMLTKIMGYIVCNVQQLAMTGDDVTHANANRLEPDLSKMGDSKTVARDDLIIMSLHDPSRYKKAMHEGYNIEKLGINYRSVILLKNRLGTLGKIPMLFDGASGEFNELPDLNTEALYKIYNEL